MSTGDKIKRIQAEKLLGKQLLSLAKFLYRAFVVIMLILIVSLLLDLKIMQTDSLDQQNTIVLELDKTNGNI